MKHPLHAHERTLPRPPLLSIDQLGKFVVFMCFSPSACEKEEPSLIQIDFLAISFSIPGLGSLFQG